MKIKRRISRSSSRSKLLGSCGHRSGSKTSKYSRWQLKCKRMRNFKEKIKRNWHGKMNCKSQFRWRGRIVNGNSIPTWKIGVPLDNNNPARILDGRMMPKFHRRRNASPCHLDKKIASPYQLDTDLTTEERCPTSKCSTLPQTFFHLPCLQVTRQRVNAQQTNLWKQAKMKSSISKMLLALCKWIKRK